MGSKGEQRSEISNWKTEFVRKTKKRGRFFQPITPLWRESAVESNVTMHRCLFTSGRNRRKEGRIKNFSKDTFHFSSLVRLLMQQGRLDDCKSVVEVSFVLMVSQWIKLIRIFPCSSFSFWNFVIYMDIQIWLFLKMWDTIFGSR